MVAPLLIYGGLASISAFLSAYQGYQLKQVSDYTSAYQLARNRDIERFYRDYERKTGQRVRYPYKDGAIPDYSRYYQSRYSSNTAYYGTAQRGLGFGGFYIGYRQSHPSYHGGYSGMYA